MKLRLTLRTDGIAGRDVAVSADGAASVQALAEALSVGSSQPSTATLSVEGIDKSSVVLDPKLPLAESPLGSGDRVAVVQAANTGLKSGFVLKVVAGPEAGKRFPLTTGMVTLGRDQSCDIQLTDPAVSSRHAKIVVADSVEVLDDRSTNGLLSAGEVVQRVALTDGEQFTVGDSTLQLEGHQQTTATGPGLSGTIAFNRSPRVDPTFEGKELVAPEPPTPQQTPRFPIVMALVPLLMGAALFAITRSALTIAFIALSPVMVVGSYVENRRTGKRQFAESVQLFEQNLAQLVSELREAHDRERQARCQEHPSAADVVEAIGALSPLLWTRRNEHDRFLQLRLGLGRQRSRTTVKMPTTRNAPVHLQTQLEHAVDPYAMVDHVPIVCDLPTAGSLGIAGPVETRTPVAVGLVTQLVGLHSPADVALAGMASTSSAARWDWLKWLPHIGSDFSPLPEPNLANGAGPATALAAEITGLIDDRSNADSPVNGPVVVVIIEDDTPVERSTLVQILERGPQVGVHTVWLADSVASLPAACRTFVELSPDSHGASTGKVIEAERVVPVVVESIDRNGAEWLSRRLAPVVDAGVASASQSDVPQLVSFLAETGVELADAPELVLDRWVESNSLTGDGGVPVRSKRSATLRALVGRTSSDAFYLDLRTHGPHALVGGTTGAGKSEFLQAWVLGMAAAHSPQRVTFLFVDYKGGAAFADCVTLPHSVGLVTDLSPHLVQRALRSLNAELQFREHVLNRKRAKDLLELERRGDPETPPSLVIVVDEFAALVQEVPEFVDGVVNVAQRGRSLGLHLILATQRPAGVIKGNLRANTNLRVALRVADEDDSTDVIGVTQAAHFDPAIPGRAIAKTGAGRLTVFQSAYVGGRTTAQRQTAQIEVNDLVFGLGEPWDLSAVGDGDQHDDETETDIARLTATIRAAFDRAQLQPPRRPWLPELADIYDLAALPTRRTDAELVFGVLDQPDIQTQGVVSFIPDLDGSMVVFGSGGSGKSTTLRSLAAAAGFTVRGGPCHVYGLDFGSRGLAMIEDLPHVGSVIDGDDHERVVRLFRMLQAIIEDRSVRFSKVNAATIDDYRRISHTPDEPRLLVLVDGLGAFRTAYETGPDMWLVEAMQAIASEGRPLGIHVIATADRLGALTTSMASAFQKKVHLRLTSDVDIAMAGIPRGGFAESTPPGRGFVDGEELQVAVFGGAAEATAQAAAISRLSASMQRAGINAAPPIARLPEVVHLDELDAEIDGLPTIGMADDTLGAVGIATTGVFLIAGHSASGRTTAVSTIVSALRRMDPETSFHYVGFPRSPLAADPRWASTAVGTEAIAEMANHMTEQVRAGEIRADKTVLVIDGVGELINSDADYPMQELLKACRSAGVFVIAEGETSDVGGSWPLLQLLRSSRYGLVLQPDQVDGDLLFRTAFPRMKRADFPVGRGVLVRQGRITRLQVAIAEA